MFRYVVNILLFEFIICVAINAQQANSFETYKSNTVDTFFGVPVADPYRWLEDLNSDSTTEWLKQQQKLARAEKKKFYGSYISAYSKLIAEGGVSYPDIIKEGPYYFQLRQTSTLSTPTLYYKTTVDGELKEAYNPNSDFKKQPVSIEKFSLSTDARYLAVSLSIAGTDWQIIVVHDLETGENLPDKIKWVKFSNITWTDSGFFYSKFADPPAKLMQTSPNSQQQLCFHKLGDSQELDAVVYVIPAKANTIFHFETTSNNHYLILYSVAKLNGEWCKIAAYKNLKDGVFSELNLFLAFPLKNDIDFSVVDYIEGKFLVNTNLSASRYRLLYCNKDSINHLEQLVPEYKEIIKSVYHVGKKILCLYLYKGAYTLAVFNYDGDLLQGIKFPEGVNVRGFYGTPADSVVRYYQNAFYTPPVVYSLNLNSYKIELVGNTKVLYDAQNYTTQIVTYKSKDGTEIPMYLSYKKGLDRSKTHPVILYGYGGFGVATNPYYNFTNIMFFESNGVLAVPLIRGGGEFGKTWHEQGKGLNKQNSFDDFIAAAQYLIDSGYTSKEKLAIRGASNGGLLVGAVLTQRPDICRVAIGDVGVYDMLRYHLFTAGRFWKDEYGISTDSTEFKNLYSYSPVHNVRRNIDYPATLLLTAENDDRVLPFHSYKFLAALQANSLNTYPHILYFEEDAGHQGSQSFEYWVRREAYVLAFMYKQMGLYLNARF